MRNDADPTSQIPTRELSLRTIWIGLGIAAVVFSVQGALLWWLLSPPRPFQLSAPVVKVRDVEAWNANVPDGLCVVYLDCDWNITTAVFRPTFQELADWCLTREIRSIDVNVGESPRVQALCEKLLTDYGLDAEEVKRTYWIGRFLWLRHGRVVDLVDIRELTQFESGEDWFEVLKQRTKDVYSFSDVRN